METIFENPKLEWCKSELKTLLEKLIEGNYHTTAKTVFDHIAHTGVETDLDQKLKKEPSLEEFLENK